MLLISRARVLSKTCNFALHKNLNKFTSNLLIDSSKIEGFSPDLQRRFLSKDANDSKFETIYEGKLTRQVKSVKIFSLTTSAMTLLSQPYLISKVLATGSTASLVTVVVTSGFFAFFTPLLLHYITGKYVSNIKYDAERDVYSATMYTLFLRKRQIEFTPDDVTRPGVNEVITTCYLHDQPAFFDVHNFTDVSHYSRIMGYDKPMDFQLETRENSQTVETSARKKN